MRSVTLKIKLPDDCRGCISCFQFQEQNVSIKVLRCAPLSPNSGHSLLRLEGDPETVDRLLSDPWHLNDENIKIEVAKSGNGTYSALVVNNNCRLSNIINESGCFLQLAIRSDDGDVIFHLVGFDAGSINNMIASARDLGYDVHVISIYEKKSWGGLTYRQEKDIRMAFDHGYYNIPSQVTLDDLASSIGISKSTLNITLRRAERKIISDYLTSSENDL